MVYMSECPKESGIYEVESAEGNFQVSLKMHLHRPTIISLFVDRKGIPEDRGWNPDWVIVRKLDLPPTNYWSR